MTNFEDIRSCRYIFALPLYMCVSLCVATVVVMGT